MERNGNVNHLELKSMYGLSNTNKKVSYSLYMGYARPIPIIGLYKYGFKVQN